MLKLDLSRTIGMVKEEELKLAGPFTELALKTTVEKSGAGAEFLGWVELPANYDKTEFTRISQAAQKIRDDSDALVVIGIGGSYLGAKAAIEMLGHTFHNEMGKARTGGVQIYYLGHNMSADYMNEFLQIMEGKELSVNVISKSGTTTEPAIAFRVMKKYMEDKYGKAEAARRIYATTDARRGALKGLAEQEEYESFVVPDDVGGRYSVLTAVGLLPIAAAGIDIVEIMAGAKDAMDHYLTAPYADNDCLKYAAARNILYRKGREIEILVNYEPKLAFFAEGWKQLYGESEGKDGKGIFPASVNFSTDLHSMGQYIQDGRRHLFETVLQVGAPHRDFEIPKDEADLDGLNFLAGKTMHEVNTNAFRGTVLAHNDGNVPNLVLGIDQLTARTFGEMVYFFELGCAVSGYTLGVNPFNQPGVEDYKKNMFALLGKPGYEELARELNDRLK